MVAPLTPSSIDAHLEQVGVAFVEWLHPNDVQSVLLNYALEQAERVFPEVRFGNVNVAVEEELAHNWDIGPVPQLMGYRDGILLFHHPGVLPVEVIIGLIQVMSELNMVEVRKGINGHGARILISFRGDGTPAFNLVMPSGDRGPAGAEPGRRRH